MYIEDFDAVAWPIVLQWIWITVVWGLDLDWSVAGAIPFLWPFWVSILLFVVPFVPRIPRSGTGTGTSITTGARA